MFVVWLRAASCALVLGCAVASLGQEILEFPANPNSFPFALTQGVDGRIWYSDIAANSIGAISLTQPVQTYVVGSTTPGGICVGPDQNIWFTGASNHVGIPSIGRMKRDGSFTLFPLPPGADSLPEQIVAGPDGNLWFSEGFDHIGRVTTAGVFTIFTIPTPTARPLGLAVGPDGAVWFAEAAAGKIGRITMDGAITEFPLPTGIALFLTGGPDGAIWFTLRNENRIGRLSLAGAFSSFPVPTSDARPGRIVSGPDGNLWFGEEIGKISRVTPSGVFTEFPIPTSNPGITGLVSGADGAIWFAEGNVSQIGRIATGTCMSTATSLCLNNQRFSVTVDWNVVEQSTSGHATAVALTPDTGYFWFFTPNNVELTVKVVDGRAFNNRFWVFGGSLSNVGYTVRVRDVTTGQTKSYVNVPGTLASFADTDAF